MKNVALTGKDLKYFVKIDARNKKLRYTTNNKLGLLLLTMTMTQLINITTTTYTFYYQ